jgi:hypothetical protein
MKKIILSLSVLLLLIASINNSLALYPEKTIEPKSKGLLSAYAGVSFGTASTTTFGNNTTEYGFSSFYIPTRFLDGGMYSINLGLGFFNQLRVEGEYLYIYQEYPYLTSDSTSPGLSLEKYKNQTAYGYQRMQKAFALNFYYDGTLISNRFYPYIGLGFGVAEFETFYVDTKLLEDQVGERYYNKPVKGQFVQGMFGLEYKLDVINASYYIQYRYVSGPKITITQNNPGQTTKPANEEDTEVIFLPAIDKILQYKNHSIGIGIKFFI